MDGGLLVAGWTTGRWAARVNNSVAHYSHSNLSEWQGPGNLSDVCYACDRKGGLRAGGGWGQEGSKQQQKRERENTRLL